MGEPEKGIHRETKHEGENNETKGYITRVVQ